MFFRNIINEFRIWARDRDQKPLILRGARQVGKTTAVDIFSEDFDRYVYLNLEKEEDAEIFGRGLSVEDLIQAIYLSKKLPLHLVKPLSSLTKFRTHPRRLPSCDIFMNRQKNYMLLLQDLCLKW